MTLQHRLNLRLALVALVLWPIPGCHRDQPDESSASVAAAAETTGDNSESANVGTEAGARCCEESEADSASESGTEVLAGITRLPEVPLIDQDGVRVEFPADVVQNKIVAMNFIFTTCKGICPPMSANFASLQKQLGPDYRDQVALISVSVDPGIDTPQRLKAWRSKFGGAPGWTLLTGKKQDVDFLQKQLGVFSPDKNDHTPFVLLGDANSGKWRRVHGLTAPETLAAAITEMCDSRKPAAVQADSDPVSGAVVTRAQKYFGDTELVDHTGRRVKFYSDLLKGKVVVINSFFSSCKGSCPVMLSSFARIQERFGERIGKDLRLISITVDPVTDTPEVLQEYAKQWKAGDGWLFVTGSKENVDATLYKLGHYVEDKESHSNIFLVGNEATGLWKKVRGLGDVEKVFPLIEEVLNDQQK